MFKFKKNKLTSIFIGIVFMLFFSFSHDAQAIKHELTGYAWSDGIGWISFNCTNHEIIPKNSPCLIPYSVTYEDSSTLNPNGYFEGWAWNDNLGWLKFGNNQPPFPPNNTPTWNTIAVTARMLNNITSGWARFCTPMGYDASNNFDNDKCTGNPFSWVNGLKLGGWDGWVSLYGNTYGPVIKNGPSIVNGSYKGIFNPADGKFSGWWWGGSEFVGWINIDGVKTDGTDPSLELRLVNSAGNLPLLNDICNGCVGTGWTTNLTPSSNVNPNIFSNPAEITVVSSQNSLIKSTLTAEWKIKGMTSCSAISKRNTNGGNTDFPSSYIITPLSDGNTLPITITNPNPTMARGTYTIDCIGSNGQNYSKTATFDIYPQGSHVYLGATPSTFPAGAFTTSLIYSTINTIPNTCVATTTLGSPTTGWDGNKTNQLQTLPTTVSGVKGSLVVGTKPKVTFRLTCNSSLNGAPVFDEADVVIGETGNITLSTDKANYCPGEKAIITWTTSGANANYISNCHASASPGPINGGVFGWNTAIPKLTKGFYGAGLLDKYLVSGGSQNNVSITPSITKYGLKCVDITNNVVDATPATVTVLSPTDPACINPLTPVINLVATNTNGGPSSHTLTVDPGDTITLDWNTNGTNFDWYNGGLGSCTASLGGTSIWKTPPQKKQPGYLNTPDWAQTSIKTPPPGADWYYRIDCDNGAGLTDFDQVHILTNPSNSSNTLNLYIKGKINDPYTQSDIYIPPNYSNGPFISWKATTPITVQSCTADYNATNGATSSLIWNTSNMSSTLTTGYVINNTYKPTPNGFFSPAEQTNLTTTNYTLECTDVNGIVYASNTVSAITSEDPPLPFDITNLLCDPGDVDDGNVDMTWDIINALNGPNPSGCKIDQDPSGYNYWSGGLNSDPASIPYPDNYKLTCNDEAGSQAFIKFYADENGCTVNQHGTKIPKWIQY